MLYHVDDSGGTDDHIKTTTPALSHLCANSQKFVFLHSTQAAEFFSAQSSFHGAGKIRPDGGRRS